MPAKAILAIAALTLCAAPLAAQNLAERETPRGTYLVFADEEGSAFVSHEPTLADSGVWPLSFFYFQAGALVGTARIAGQSNCTQGVVSGRLTHATGADGSLMELPQSGDTPMFAFDRAGGGGDEAIVGFICAPGQLRLKLTETPIHASPEITARTYASLRALGLRHRLARSIAIRDRGTTDPLIETAVPEALRAQVRAVFDAAN